MVAHYTLIILFCSEEIGRLLKKPESEDGDYSPNFKSGTHLNIRPDKQTFWV